MYIFFFHNFFLLLFVLSVTYSHTFATLCRLFFEVSLSRIQLSGKTKKKIFFLARGKRNTKSEEKDEKISETYRKSSTERQKK